MFEKIFDLVKENFKNPKLYIGILILGFVLLLLFPYLDANLFYFNRVNNRVEILNNITQLDIDKINSNDVLQEEYSSILQEINKQKDGSLSNVFSTKSNTTEDLIKFITGGILFWILAIACFFIKTFKNFGFRIFGFILCGGLGVAFGYLAKATPIVLNPVINYIGFPLLIFVVAAILITRSQKSKTENKRKLD